MNASTSRVALEEALARMSAHSGFLGRLLEQNQDIAYAAVNENLESAWIVAREVFEGSEDGRVALRQHRNTVALLTALGDLSGENAFETTVTLLSDFADQALSQAIEIAFTERCGDGPVQGFAAIALGKHGSRELNYSSDIDLLFLMDPNTLPVDESGDPQKIAVRIGRDIVDILQERTGDGYVLRVDLRLRPSPEVTPIVLPVNAAISYYESSAEPWERAAFIRARAVGGDNKLGQHFLDVIQPFVWRRALDFGAITEIRSISNRIRDHYERGQDLGPGFDLKRGRGGIREIEFYAQIQQLIHGGREPELRVPATLDALKALASAGHIDEIRADKLADAYRLFRTIEHRLQMVDDRQTHSLPENPMALDNVAQLHGLGNGAALLDMLAAPVEFVGSCYDELVEDGAVRLPKDASALEDALAKAGFEAATDARRRIEGWRDGKQLTTRSLAAREALEAMLPTLIEDFGASPDPIGSINRFDSLLSRLPSAVNFFRLIEARPGLGRMLVNILSHAPALADELARRAELFDTLIDATALEPPEPLDELIDILSERSRSNDYQLKLDRMRQLVGEERFALGVQLIERASDPLDVAAGYSRVAEATLNILTKAAIAEFESKHGAVPDSEFLILALGRLGGEALTHASDLDLVYLYTGDHAAESDGERSLGATSYYQRLAQRVTAALSVPTASGPLYEVDTRLRPSGSQGLLAVSLESFAQYQRENAWTWEHMALARARPVFGSSSAREKLQNVLDAALSRDRDEDKLVTDVRKMRAEMAEHKPPAGLLDVKLIEGGLVDLEFCVHLIQLRDGAGLDPHLPTAIKKQVAVGLLPDKIPEAHNLLTRMLVTLRLVSPASTDVPAGSQSLVANACGFDDWQSMLADFDDARQCVSETWARLAPNPEGND